MMLDAVQDTYDHLVFFAEEYLVDKTRTILKSDLFDLSEWSGKVSVRTINVFQTLNTYDYALPNKDPNLSVTLTGLPSNLLRSMLCLRHLMIYLG